MDINIISYNLSYKDEQKIYNKIYSDLRFKKITTKYKEKLKTIFPTVSYPIIKSIRNEYTINNIVQTHYKIDINALNEEYKNMNIKKISKKYELPPCTLLKMIYKNRGYTKNEVNNIFGGIYDKLDEYDIKQLKKALKNDVFALIDSNKQLDKSIKFEKKIETVLNKLHIQFKTQNMLADEQQKMYGKSIITPDFLLLNSNFCLNGMRVNWIDAKNYYLTCTAFSKKKIQKQIEKYINVFGTGVIIMSLGRCENIFFKDVTVISYDDFVKGVSKYYVVTDEHQ